MGTRMFSIRIAGSAAAIALSVAACGSDAEPAAKPAGPAYGIDISRLDVGNYPVQPRSLGNATGDKQSRHREGQRLAEYVLHPVELDPAFGHNTWPSDRGHIVLDRKPLAVLLANDTFTEVAQDLVTGWVTAASTAMDEKNGIVLVNAVMVFPNEQRAKEVAEQLERDDFTYNRDNQPVQVPKHPAARAHWRPQVPGVGSWLAHGRFVVMTNVKEYAAAPNLPSHVSWIERLLDRQLPLLDQFKPTASNELKTIPLDPDGLLGRALPSPKASPSRTDGDLVVGPRGAISELLDPKFVVEDLRAAGTDLVAFGNSVVIRTRDAAAATTLFDKLTGPSASMEPTEGPSGVGQDARCSAPKPVHGQRPPIGWVCFVKYDRFVAEVSATGEQDLMQRAAAQYALLAAR